MTRPLVARIHSSALTHNLQRIRELAPASRLWAVIKANAYGHGLLRAAGALSAADGYALLMLDEALQLRAAGFRQDLLLLEGVFAAAEYALCAEYHIATVIHSAWQLEALASQPLSAPLTVYLKVNTGMNRLGFPPADVPAVLQRLQGLPQVDRVTLMTHFARADEAGGLSAPCAVFDAVAAGVGLPQCIANSAAIFADAGTHRDAVRPGIVLYGSSPFADRTAADLGLQAAMTLASEIIAVQTVQPGAAVGYGATFIAERPMRVGIVACGYADGYPRHAGTGTPVLVAGQRSRLLGRVSMDMLAVDLTELPGTAVGAPVELWGQQLPVDDVAHAAGTISYELLTAVAPRVKIIEE